MASRTKSRKKQRPSRRKNNRRKESGEPGLGRRPSWQGNLKLSLVSCPVALYSAINRGNDIAFHLINPETHNRIRMIPTDPETGPIERSELVKGYEIAKDRYVVVSNEELDAVSLETTRTVDIERFVDAHTIDRLYWDEPYYLLPNDREGMDAYLVIRDALKETGRVALGRVVMHTRERLLALEPREDGILATTLRTTDEVLSPAVAFRDVPEKRTEPEMIEIAEKIIEQREGPFDPEQFTDRYEAALHDLIRRKERGEKPINVEKPPAASNVIDLMEALRRSVKSGGVAGRQAGRHASRRSVRRSAR